LILSPGDSFGTYTILGPLGAGGMGEVYRARDERLKRDVALKVLAAEAAREPGRVERFEVEAQAASALNHPSIVVVYEIGRAATPDGTDAFRSASSSRSPPTSRTASRGRTNRGSFTGISSRPISTSRARAASRSWTSASRSSAARRGTPRRRPKRTR
jgi:serine/threonine protein kinase